MFHKQMMKYFHQRLCSGSGKVSIHNIEENVPFSRSKNHKCMKKSTHRLAVKQYQRSRVSCKWTGLYSLWNSLQKHLRTSKKQFGKFITKNLQLHKAWKYNKTPRVPAIAQFKSENACTLAIIDQKSIKGYTERMRRQHYMERGLCIASVVQSSHKCGTKFVSRAIRGIGQENIARVLEDYWNLSKYIGNFRI